MTEELQYGNWIRKKMLVFLGLGALASGVLSLLPLPPIVRVGGGLLCVVLFISFLYPLYAYYVFSPRGGNFQDKLYDLLVKSLKGPITGAILDIGAGNGILSVQLARAYPTARVVGVDYWGKNWEYSQAVCERNAQLARVSERTTFQKGDAAALPFSAATFDAVVSNLTFHEVKSVQQKRELIGEALRVLRPGGTFAVVDLFYDHQYYGDSAELETFLRGLNLARVEFKPLNSTMTIPRLLNHPQALGRAGIIFGLK